MGLELGMACCLQLLVKKNNGLPRDNCSWTSRWKKEAPWGTTTEQHDSSRPPGGPVQFGNNLQLKVT